jgi:DNA-binding response OmpR family regulator
MKKIIVAEGILQAIGRHATIFGRGTIELYTARSSEEILKIQRARKADLIITDITLPLMGGAKLCSVIRGDADLKDVSIIMICDVAEAASVQCKEARANAVILKPVDPVELFSRMSELLVIPQRQHIRSLLHVSINGREGNNSFLSVSNNISISGLLLETEQALKKDDRVTCAVAIGRREIVADCVVTRVDKPVSGKFRYGIKFVNLDTKSLVIIDQFVKGGIKH